MKISFCIIKTPFSIDDDDYTIFFTKSGLDHLDCTIRETKEYGGIINFLKKHGYIEFSDLSFEFVGSHKTKRTSKRDLTKYLRSKGMSYSSKLEKNMIYELNQIRGVVNPNTAKNILNSFLEDLRKEALIDNNFKEMMKLPFPIVNTNNLPKIDEEVELSFYLVLDFVYSEKQHDFAIDLNGSFLLDKPGIKHYRNVVKISTEKFQRFESGNINKNFIHLKSKKTKGEMLNEISFLYEVIVDIIKKNNDGPRGGYEKIEFYFDLFDIKEKIKLQENIILSVSREDYDSMTSLSESIKKTTLKQQESKNIDFFEVEETCNELKEHLSKKMLIYADNEEFDIAADIKKNIETISDKINTFKKKNPKEKSINSNMFHEYFNLK